MNRHLTGFPKAKIPGSRAGASVYRLVCHPRYNFSEVIDLGFHIAIAPQTAFNIEQATKITAHHGARTGHTDVDAFILGHARRNFAKLDRERAAETAAFFSVLHFAYVASCLREQLARLGFDTEFAQTSATVVIRDGAVE